MSLLHACCEIVFFAVETPSDVYWCKASATHINGGRWRINFELWLIKLCLRKLFRIALKNRCWKSSLLETGTEFEASEIAQNKFTWMVLSVGGTLTNPRRVFFSVRWKDCSLAYSVMVVCVAMSVVRCFSTQAGVFPLPFCPWLCTIPTSGSG
jgi:hypothetical protein